MDCLQTEETGTHSPPPFMLVSTADCFQTMLDCLMKAPRLAIDIEADSLYHYFEKVCLIQISTDSDTFILDPLAVDRIGDLAPLMSDPKVEKVFHAAGYDVHCLRRDYGFVFANIFDTHVAAQLLGYEFLGLSPLMEKILGIHHSKRRQRDDWSHRPLAAEQLEYAAMDTHHLLRLRDALEIELQQKGRLSWAQEEFDTAALLERPDKEFDANGFRRIKGNRELTIQNQTVLRALYLFREEAARKLDVPPFKVMNNSVLLDLVRHPPQSAHAMINRPGISYRVARKFAADILNTITEARKQDPSVLEAPARNSWKAPNHAARLRLEKLKQWRLRKSAELDLNVGVVFPANLLENLAVAPPAGLEGLASLPGTRRWRLREFGEEILQLLRSEESQPGPAELRQEDSQS
jgi:ribonuclease D